ncbi:DUF7446 family protein [Mycolicibacterium sphagni]|uniref:Uncharacterized protein n=1 Tax=Mycolicibacterium sphagni TaxID=1786 RepID=A0ABX2JWP4_9MYCO|nr:hypothetical protein [Mycolicibacterium sphagni]NTY62153.1 hypothetical protein [Mycolicibacterium sphagni]
MADHFGVDLMRNSRGSLGVKFDEPSRRILVGTMNDAQDDLLDEKEDVTSTAVVAVADYVFAGTGAIEVNLGDDTAYRIEVVKIGRTRSGDRIALLPGSGIVGLPGDDDYPDIG